MIYAIAVELLHVSLRKIINTTAKQAQQQLDLFVERWGGK
jgi:hypothetical protein